MLNRFCAPLCDFVRADAPGGADSHLIIDQLERGNLFLVHLDNERRWYRYHHAATYLALRHGHFVLVLKPWEE
jgi:LuxR family transcriptional regulator, maltose regulon positive regulatory protein